MPHAEEGEARVHVTAFPKDGAARFDLRGRDEAFMEELGADFGERRARCDLPEEDLPGGARWPEKVPAVRERGWMGVWCEAEAESACER